MNSKSDGIFEKNIANEQRENIMTFYLWKCLWIALLFDQGQCVVSHLLNYIYNITCIHLFHIKRNKKISKKGWKGKSSISVIEKKYTDVSFIEAKVGLR